MFRAPESEPVRVLGLSQKLFRAPETEPVRIGQNVQSARGGLQSQSAA
jgi:hypothetical protein